MDFIFDFLIISINTLRNTSCWNLHFFLVLFFFWRGGWKSYHAAEETFLSRDPTCASCFEVQSPNLWISREVLLVCFWSWYFAFHQLFFDHPYIIEIWSLAVVWLLVQVILCISLIFFFLQFCSIMPTYFCHIMLKILRVVLPPGTESFLWAIWVYTEWNRPWAAEQTCYLKTGLYGS